MAHDQSKNTWRVDGDEDGVGKSRRKTIESSGRLPVRREYERHESVVALDGDWTHVDIS